MLENICVPCAVKLGGEWKHDKKVTLNPVLGYCCECDKIEVCSHKVHWKFVNKKGERVLSKAEQKTAKNHEVKTEQKKPSKKTWF